MPLALEAVRNRTRVDAGSPSTDEISNDSIDKFIGEALDEINKEVAYWAIFYVTSVKDQQEYAIDATVLQVLFCDWSGEQHLSNLFDADFDYVIDSQFGVDPETGQYQDVLRALMRAQVTNRFAYVYREADRILFLIPPPTQSGTKIYYIGEKAWTIDKVPARFEKYVAWYATAQVLRAIARKRRRLSAVGHTGQATVWSEADPTLKDAQDLEDKFYEYIRREGKLSLF